MTVSANRLSATMTPSAPLLPNTYYGVYLCGYYCDIAGNYGTAYSRPVLHGNQCGHESRHGDHDQPE